MDRTGRPVVTADARTFETAYRLHRESLVRLLTSITRDSATAEDLAQEAFLRLAREMDAGRTPDDIGAWLRRVGGNLAASRGRRLAVAARHAGRLEPPAAPPEPERLALDAERRVALIAALAELPRADRQALLLAAAGYRGPEIAAVVHRSAGATRTKLYRARVRVREQLAARGYVPA